MKNRVEAGKSYWFRKSWDKKRNKESLVANDDEGKIIIPDRIPDPEIAGEYEISSVKRIATNYSIVSIGERKKPEDLFSEICLDDAVAVLKKFGFGVFIREYEHATKSDGHGNCVMTLEYQLIAWHHKLGIFVNGGSWDSGASFNNLNIKFPNFFSKAAAYVEHYRGMDIYECSVNKMTINVVNSRGHNILSTIISELQQCNEIKKGIEVAYNINGKRSYLDLYNYDMRDKDCQTECKKVYDMLPDSGKRFIDEHTFIRND